MKEFYFIFHYTKENVELRESLDSLGIFKEFSRKGLTKESEGIARFKIKIKNNISMEVLIDKLEKYYSVNGYNYVCVGVIPLGEINVC